MLRCKPQLDILLNVLSLSSTSLFSIITLSILGALIGSFANVVIYRVPAGKSIIFPGSSCPHCNHQIRWFENIPIFSWLFLKGKCSSCKAGISFRYPLIELSMAVLFGLLAWRWPLFDYGYTVLPLMIVLAMVLMMSIIDIDTFMLPDSLTLPSIIIALIGTFLYTANNGLPNFSEGFFGAAVGAGIIALINRVGSLVVRRFADTKERLWPLGMDQVNVAAVAGALAGWVWGLAAAAVSLVINLVSRKILRLPELIMYAFWLVALVVSTTGVFGSVITGISGTFIAAGIVSIVGSLFWWFKDMIRPEPESTEDDDEPVAMGFGDVKLAAVLGALLGWQNLLAALMLSFIIGAIGGVTARIAGGDRIIPFGPYLALGGLIALFFGNEIVTWYLNLLGV